LPVEANSDDPRSLELSGRLLLYALEIVGDPGAAEGLLAGAAGRALRWSRPAETIASHRAMLHAVTAVSHGPLNRCPRHPLPADLLPPGDEFDHEIETVLSGLPGRERVALLLVLVEGFSYEECAAVLGTTAANAGMLVYRARAALRSRLVGSPNEALTTTSSLTLPTTNQRISRVLRSDCRQAGAFISADIDNELSEKQRAVLAAHMESCPICGEERDRLERTSAAVAAHWRLLLEQLIAGGWSRRADRAAARGSLPTVEVVRLKRMRLGLVVACGLIVAAAAALWMGLLRQPLRAVTSAEGDFSRRGRAFEARGHTRLELFDGSSVEMQAGATLHAERQQGMPRPKLRLLAGGARFVVRPGAEDLVVETAAGRAAASSGSFHARLVARDARGRRLKIRFTTADSLAPGERLALGVDSESERLVMAGNSGPSVSVPPGSLFAVPVGERPRPVAVPGRWVELGRAGGHPPARYGGTLTREETEGLLVLFGGSKGGVGGSPMSDLWVTDPVLGKWMQISRWEGAEGGSSGKPRAWPKGQSGGALLSAADTGLWLYCGRGLKADIAELWSLELARPLWKRLPFRAAGPPTGKDGDPGDKKKAQKPGPLGRRGAALTYSPAAGGIVLVGGEVKGRSQKDTWLFEIPGKTWRRLASEGPHPEARAGAVLAELGSGAQVYLFGGRSLSRKTLNDTWCLDMSGNEAGIWRLVKLSRRPSSRSAPAAAVAGAGRMVLFGGRPRLGGPRSDTWVLRKVAISVQWDSLASPVRPAPGDFPAPAMVWEPDCRAMVLWNRDRLWTLRLK
jgi:DNA-directed RNA polymerase specialized sigma24 family protein